MIDWASLGRNALWIFGCSLALAGLSYASWRGSQRALKFGEALRSPGVRLALHLGGVLFCASLALITWDQSLVSRLQTLLWAFLGLGLAAHWKLG